jgi:transposase
VYALGLELTDPGFDFTILSDFRQCLLEGGAEQVLLDAMLAVFKERGWLKPRQRQRTDSTHVQDIRASDHSTDVRRRGHALCTGQPRCWSFRLAAGP